MKCKYRKDDDEPYKIQKLAPSTQDNSNNNVNNNLKNTSEESQVCGVCGNIDVVHEEGETDDSWALSWIACEVCLKWYHQDCLGVNLDINDFICSNECVEKDNKQSRKTTRKKKSGKK